MTGNIGKPGTGPNSITGQCNAMGSRLYSNVTSLIGGRDFMKAEHRAQVAALLNIPLDAIPTKNSWAYDQIVDGIRAGKIKALWVIATNPSHSWGAKVEKQNGLTPVVQAGAPASGHGAKLLPGTDHAVPEAGAPTQGEGKRGNDSFNQILAKLDFLVVQDMFTTTETAQRADLLLPAAGWGEKEGTFINSERRLGLIKKVSSAPGEALSDFNIFRLLAHYWGCGAMFAEWSSPEAAFHILKRLSAGQPCDITGIVDYAHLDAAGGIQWPFPVRNSEFGVRNGGQAPETQNSALHTPHSAFKERRLFADGQFFTPDGKAKFLFDQPRAVAEPTNEEFPFVLLTGRGTSAQWHTNTRTDKSAILRTLYPANAYVEIHPSDLARLGLVANQPVAVRSRQGRIECTAVAAPSVQPGQVFIPMHYEVANQLTRTEYDPHSRQPSYKYCAAQLEKISRSTKLQHPSSREAPTSKLQRPAARLLVVWGLELGFSLVLGCWSLELSPPHLFSFHHDQHSFHSRIRSVHRRATRVAQRLPRGLVFASPGRRPRSTTQRRPAEGRGTAGDPLWLPDRQRGRPRQETRERVRGARLHAKTASIE
jgi:assimilatory nitrate reductase catalytic subunit